MRKAPPAAIQVSLKKLKVPSKHQKLAVVGHAPELGNPDNTECIWKPPVCATRYTRWPASVLRHLWRRKTTYCVDIVFASEVCSRGAWTCLTGLWSISCCGCEPGFCRLSNLFSPESSYKMPLASKVETSRRIAQTRQRISIDHADNSQAPWVGRRKVLTIMPWLLEILCTCQVYRKLVSGRLSVRAPLSMQYELCRRQFLDCWHRSIGVTRSAQEIRKPEGSWPYSRVKLLLPHKFGRVNHIPRSSTYGIVHWMKHHQMIKTRVWTGHDVMLFYCAGVWACMSVSTHNLQDGNSRAFETELVEEVEK